MDLSTCNHHKIPVLECLQCRATFIAEARRLKEENVKLRALIFHKDCPCGAPYHQGLCRDALAEMNGRRDGRWKPVIV